MVSCIIACSRSSFYSMTLLGIFAISLLGSVHASGEIDGCRNSIRRASMVYVNGSPGYGIDCTSPASSLAFMRGGRSYSLIESRRVDPVIDVCFQGSGSTSQLSTAPFVEVQLDSTYVIRGVDFSALSSQSPPVSLAINARSTYDGSAGWFVSQSDSNSGAAWTNLVVGPNQQLDTDLAGQYVRVMPNLPASASNSANGFGFGFELYGCSVAGTSLISFQFKSSRAAIIQKFNRIDAFLTQLTSYVCYITKFTTAPGSCSRILFAELSEGTTPNTLSNGIGPSTIPTIEVTFRVLPPGPSCVDCRTASTVQAQLSADLALRSTKSSQILRALDAWIEDSDPFSCYNKVCAAGTLCVNGACVTASEMEAITAANAQIDTQLLSAAQIDQTLQLSPLSVISGADQSSGILTFLKAAVTPGTVLKASSDTSSGSGAIGPKSSSSSPETPSSDESFLKRFLIPISVGSGVLLIIAGLIGWRFYKRSQMTAAQRDHSA